MAMELLLPDSRQMRYGWRFLLFQLTFMGYFLSLGLALLNLTVSDAGFNFLFYCISFLVVAVLFRRFWLNSLRQVSERIANVLLALLIGFVAVRLLTIAINVLIYWLNPNFSNANDQSIAETTRQSLLLTGIVTVFLAPVAEEALYRGVVFGSLFGRSKVAAYLTSTGLFAFAHISGYIGLVPVGTLGLAFVQYLPAGAILAGAYHYSGNLLAPILLHAALNALAIFAMR